MTACQREQVGASAVEELLGESARVWEQPRVPVSVPVWVWVRVRVLSNATRYAQRCHLPHPSVRGCAATAHARTRSHISHACAHLPTCPRAPHRE